MSTIKFFIKRAMLLFALIFSFESWASAGLNGTDKKIIELQKIISLSSQQEKEIRHYHSIYSQTADSALLYVDDPYESAQIKYDANKVFHEALMGILSDSQRNKYIYVAYSPEVKAKTEAKIKILAESGTYTDKDLNKMKKEIFEYLMKEKIVYFREKYNIDNQKQNIHQLKKHQPKALKEANAQEKLKHNGKPHRGRYQW